MIRVAGYCRVSTDKEDQANSYESQKSFFRNYIAENPNWELYKIYADEGISGTSTKKRKEFIQMIHDAHAGKFHLILTKEVSRFSRNIVDTLNYTRELKRIGVAVEFVTDHLTTMDSDGELRLSIMATIAQDESRKTSNRVVWGQTRSMEKGTVFGLSMLGYDLKDGKLTIEPKGAELVRLIFQKYAVEQIGTSQIARFLTQSGYRTYHGSIKWRASSIIKILKNEKYVGDLVQKKTYTPDYLSHEKRTNNGDVPLIFLENHHDPIISRDLWNLAQKRMRQNNKHGSYKDGHSNRYVFSGKIKCGECGASFVGRIRTLRNGTKVRRWSCSTAVREGASACGIGKLLRDDDAMNILKTSIKNLQIDSEYIIRNVTQLTLDAIHTVEGSTADTPERLQFEIQKIQTKKESVMDLYFSGDIVKEDMLSMKKQYEIQQDAFHERLKRAMKDQNTGNDTLKRKEEISKIITAVLSGETKSDILYKILLDRLTVFKDNHLELSLLHLPMVFHFVISQ